MFRSTWTTKLWVSYIRINKLFNFIFRFRWTTSLRVSYIRNNKLFIFLFRLKSSTKSRVSYIKNNKLFLFLCLACDGHSTQSSVVVEIIGCGCVTGWPDQKVKNQNFFFQIQKKSDIFFVKSEINQQGQFSHNSG